MVYVKYDPKNNLPTHGTIIPNQIDKEVEALESIFCDNKESEKPHSLTERADTMTLYTGTYWLPTCAMVDPHRASESARKFKGSFQL